MTQMQPHTTRASLLPRECGLGQRSGPTLTDIGGVRNGKSALVRSFSELRASR